MIVFCDGCNTPWHQHCHDPPIGAEVVQVQEKEWFCSACMDMKEEGLDLEGRVAGQGLTVDEVGSTTPGLQNALTVVLTEAHIFQHPFS